MRSSSIACLGLVFFLLAAGCDDGGGCGCDLPRRANDWLVRFDLGYIPDVIAEYPVDIPVTVQVTHLETGQPAPDGMLVILFVEPGSFVGGANTVELYIANGRVVPTVVADAPAVYTLTVELPGQSRTITTTFGVGL